MEVAQSSSRCSRLALAGLLGALLLGVVFRLIWISDMEYKADEMWTWEHVQSSRQSGAVPGLGMRSSADITNPGMSLWVFIGLAIITDAQTPPELGRAVGGLNAFALLLLLLFVWRSVPVTQREPWLWTLALYAVNPFAVLFHRKIWAQSALPFFVVVMLIGWWYRRRFWGAAVWGLFGAILGQIHMGGFIFSAGITMYMLVANRRGISWRGWLLGSIIGVLGLIPWLSYLWERWHTPNPTAGMPTHDVHLEFWCFLVSDPFGWGLNYSLDDEMWAFIREPVIGGLPTYGVALLHGILLVVALRFVLPVMWQMTKLPKRCWQALSDQSTDTALIQNAAIWPYGLILTVALLPQNRHYLVILHVFEILAVCRLAFFLRQATARRWLLILCLTQAFLSAAFLWYIHTSGDHAGDYGMPYRLQPGSEP